MVKKHAVTLIAVSEIPGITGQEIVTAIVVDLNARGIFLESILVEEVRDNEKP